MGGHRAAAGPPWAVVAGGGPARGALADAWGWRLGGVAAVPAAADRRGWLRGLAEALRGVPAEVAVLFYTDAEAAGTPGGAVAGALLDRLQPSDAGVAAAEPVTDALKRVDGDRLVASVDRRGLYLVGTPQVVRRPALQAVLAAAVARGSADAARGAGGGSDGGGGHSPAALLLEGGQPVRILAVSPAAGPGERR